MVKFRRSLKSEKHDSVRHHQHTISIPQKDEIAILPPKKVIKALYDYDGASENPMYLSFVAGDFLHVVDRESDTEWYEACNPLVGTRGLVPVSFFHEVGKTVRDSQGTQGSGSRESSVPSLGQHDSGFADNQQPIPDPLRLSKMVKQGQPVYGVVAYDFKAERPDELDAREGEAIIVIAQSNPDWFVAKPITRLGGPGLIPVSFIEIKDLATGQIVADPHEAVAKAGIPKVEEWKKMAAEYKNTSIPLGQLSSNLGPGAGAGAGGSRSGSVDGLQQGMERMSVGGQSQSNGNGNGYTGQSRSPSTYAPSQQPQWTLAPVRASVPRYVYAEDKFHFVVEVTFNDFTHWDLTRIYEDFYELQINLIKAFPEEAGNAGHPRTLPLMPGPVQFVTDRITDMRRENLDEYLYKLIRMGPKISHSALVRGFFQPRGYDFEVDTRQIADPDEHSRSAFAPGGDRYGLRDSTASSQTNSNWGPPPQAPASATARQSSNSSSQSFASHQRSQQSIGSLRNTHSSQGHYRNPSEYAGAPLSTVPTNPPPPITRQMTAASGISTTSTMAGASGALKIKVWYDRETCVVLRMPPKGQFSYAELYRKIVERRRLEFSKNAEAAGGQEVGEDEELDVEYRDEGSGDYYKLGDEEGLEAALARNDKLTLVVRVADEGAT